MDAEQTAGAAAKALTKKSKYESKDGAKVLENKVEADQTLTSVHLEESRAAREARAPGVTRCLCPDEGA
ncbi:hypothetical protein E4U10_001479 [Claviceps purpurea]|nr:hypothetical protein E4U27_004664 [Claviceps purpurea]KAG6200807.1 hypothetical protein E4U10_001479 [Claviceps purpurea]KAG6223976.1 hypothetical protein E4U26_004106 [Claviceps purpurea]KAG6305160.1 hypothetical protein E4U45_000653 [Claviceps purpurea]